MRAMLALVMFCPAVFGKACPANMESAKPPEIALCELERGLADYKNGQNEQAEAHYLRALAAGEEAGYGHRAIEVGTLIGLGRVYQASHRYSEAENMLRRGLDLSLPLEPTEPRLNAVILSRLGGVYSVAGSVEQARSVLTEAITKLRALGPAELPELAYAYDSLGMTELRAGSYTAGEADLRQAVTMATNCLGENDPQTAIYETNLGLALHLQGEDDRALPLLRRAEFLLESKPDKNGFQLGTALAELSVVEAAQGRLTLAENYAARALAVFNTHFTPDSSEVARAQVNLAAIYLVERKTAQAAQILPAAVAAERTLLGKGRPLANGIRWMAQLRAQQRAWREAESLYHEAIQMYETEPGPAPAEIGTVRREYATVLKQEHGKAASDSPAT